MPKSPYDMSEAEIRRFCRNLLQDALQEAVRLKHNYIGTEHIFIGLTRNENGLLNMILVESGLDPREVRNAVRREVGSGDDVVSSEPPLTPRAYRVLAQAVYLADDLELPIVTDEPFLLVLFQDEESVPARKLRQMGVDIHYWIQHLLHFLDIDQEREAVNQIEETHFEPFKNPFESSIEDLPISRGQRVDEVLHEPTPLLDKFGRDLTEQARQGRIHKAIGRDDEIRAVARTLTRSKKNNPLLVGDAGVGKTAIVEGLAWQIANGEAPAPLKKKRIIQIEIGTIVAGTSLRGQFEERLNGIVYEVRSHPDIILFIDEIHTIVGAGDTIDSNLDAANILKPALARGELSCIGATTFEEYRKAIAKDPALDRRFRTIDIKEPSLEDSLLIIEQVYQRFEKHHKVSILPEARTAAVRLSSQYMVDRRLPDKALDLLDEACARVVIQSHSPDTLSGRQEVTVNTIHQVLSEWTGIPISDLQESERERFAKMEEMLKERVRGQEHAVKLVADTIKTHRAGLSDPHRPMGVFLFVGPSGVGKTELAKALAHFMFNNENAMIRLDMSEFHDEHTVARLIGAPPGYKGTEQGGQLTEALRRNPYSVVLLDEVEKATSAVFDIFLQVFDEGRLTDSIGSTVDARHAIWIMTSNIGTGDVGKGIGFTAGEEYVPDYSFHIKRFFRPEFLNRVDETVVFRPLSTEILNEILDLQISEVYQRLEEQGLHLVLDSSARELLLKEGYDPANGARPLRRAVERLVTRPLSSALIEEIYKPGDTIRVVARDRMILFENDKITRPIDLMTPKDTATDE
jgi:ATP-dependent Clp protease ATP-binding subunit ClpC